MLPYPSLFGSLATKHEQTAYRLVEKLPYPSLFGSLATHSQFKELFKRLKLPYPSLFGSLATHDHRNGTGQVSESCHTLLFSGHLQLQQLVDPDED